MTARRHLHSVPSSPPADDLGTVVDALVTGVDEFARSARQVEMLAVAFGLSGESA